MHVDDERRLACADKLFARRRIVESVCSTAIGARQYDMAWGCDSWSGESGRCPTVNARVPG